MLSEWLKTHHPDELSLVLCKHPTLPLTIYNYQQCETPKLDPLGHEARSLVLDNNLNVVSRSFNRFFNLGEIPVEFNWGDYKAYTKEDGSIMSLFWYEPTQEWIVRTRGGFQSRTKTNVAFSDLFWRNLKNPGVKDYTLVFELVGPHNKIVRSYEEGLYLLAGINNEGELSDEELDRIARIAQVDRPKRYELSSLNQVEQLLKDEPDPTFEGYVCYDGKNRLKIKSLSYLALHRSLNNGIVNPNNFAPIYLQGEQDEILAYFPEFTTEYRAYTNRLDNWKAQMDSHYKEWAHLESQKDFALKVKDESFSGLCFQARRQGKLPSELITEKDIVRFLDGP